MILKGQTAGLKRLKISGFKGLRAYVNADAAAMQQNEIGDALPCFWRSALRSMVRMHPKASAHAASVSSLQTHNGWMEWMKFPGSLSTY